MTEVVQCELSGSEGSGVNVQVRLLKEPVPAPVRLKVTVPVGFDLVPLAVSSTCASQVLAWFRVTVLGEQVTVVDVERRVTVRANVPLLVAWVDEPLYVPVIVCVPVPNALGV